MIWYRYTLRTSSDFYLRPKQILVNSLVSWSGNLLWYGFSSSKSSTKSSGEAAEDINNNERRQRPKVQLQVQLRNQYLYGHLINGG